MAPRDPVADLVLTGGTIVTLDPRGTVAEAIAIAGDRILAVGAAREVERLAGPSTTVVPLDGRAVIPGFIDAHAHMEREGLKRRRLSLQGARSVADVLERIAAEARRRPPGEWILTMPVGEPPFYFNGPETLAERRMPTRAELDGAAPDHPVCITGVFGNWGRPPGYTALNTLGLRRAGVDRTTTPRCAGVTIEHDASGEPTGLIIEKNARPTVEFDVLRALPRFTSADRREALRESMRLYNAVGTTSVYEGHGSSPETIEVYRELRERGELTVRVSLVISPTWDDPGEADRVMRDWLAYARGAGLGDPWLRVSGVAIDLGGDPTVARMTRAMLPDTGWTGFVESASSLETYRAYVRLAARHGLRVHTIVTDRLDDVLPVLEEVDATHPLAGRRWVLVHVGRARAEQIHELRRLGIHVTTIPVYMLWKNAEHYLADADGGESVVPHRALLDAGIPTAMGTDNIPYDPFVTLSQAVNRIERTSGRVIGPGQRLTPAEALPLLARNGARLSFDEERKGTLEPGKLADLAVLSEDPTRATAASIGKIATVMTVVGGRIVHRV